MIYIYIYIIACYIIIVIHALGVYTIVAEETFDYIRC